MDVEVLELAGHEQVQLTATARAVSQSPVQPGHAATGADSQGRIGGHWPARVPEAPFGSRNNGMLKSILHSF